MHVDMSIVRYSCEVALLTYCERGGLEKHRGGPPRSSYSRGNLVTLYTGGGLLKKIGVYSMTVSVYR